MPKYRNISDEELWLPHLDRSVKPDEVIDVEADEREWPESVWAPVGGPSKKKDDA